VPAVRLEVGAADADVLDLDPDLAGAGLQEKGEGGRRRGEVMRDLDGGGE
jgi:hypothetical protein